MNVVGLLIGIIFWALILWLIPSLPLPLKVVIAALALTLFVLFLHRVYLGIREFLERHDGDDA